MSGNICRCSAYPEHRRGDPRHRRQQPLRGRDMKAFTYERPATVQDAAKLAAERPNAKFIAGGTNLLDLMKLQVETPATLIDVNRLPLDTVEATPEGGLRIGALVRNSDLAADPRVRQGLRGAGEGAAGRRLGPAAQQGDHRRQPAPADALLLFLRHGDALQQARARLRLLGDRRVQPHHGGARRERGLHRHQPVRHGRRHAGARRHRRDHGSGRAARAPSRSPTSTGCPATRRRSRPTSARARSSPP